MEQPGTMLSVRNISKTYQKTDKLQVGLSGKLTEAMAGVFQKDESLHADSFWALQDISFDLHAGEVLGIVGQNGSGKSTLLRIISGITEPTTGEVFAAGKISSIIDVGTGFHPDLSGKDNIFLAASIMGYARADIQAQYDNIVAFSEIGDFLDMPVKHYSSGMFVRLAFSVIAHLTTEIIVIDEVLSVGDASFRVKSMQKLRQLAREGKTIVMVSHDMTAISQMCKRCIVLDHGHVIHEGKTDEVISAYLEESLDLPKHNISKLEWPEGEQPGNELITLQSVALTHKNDGTPGEFYVDDDLELHLNFNKKQTGPVRLAMILNYQLTQQVFFIAPDRAEGGPAERMDAPGQYEFTCHFPANLFNKGLFTIDLFVTTPDDDLVFDAPGVFSFTVKARDKHADAGDRFNYLSIFRGPLVPVFNWQVRRDH